MKTVQHSKNKVYVGDCDLVNSVLFNITKRYLLKHSGNAFEGSKAKGRPRGYGIDYLGPHCKGDEKLDKRKGKLG